MNGRPHRTMKYWRMIALVVIVILIAGIGQTSLGHSILRKAGLFEAPASYTSLAFLHPQSPADQPGLKRTTVDVSFVINNAGGIPRDYQWSVTLAQGRRTHDVAAGSVRIASGRGATITRSAQISCAQGQVRIVVSLASPAEFIDAWTACPPLRKPKPTSVNTATNKLHHGQ